MPCCGQIMPPGNQYLSPSRKEYPWSTVKRLKSANLGVPPPASHDPKLRTRDTCAVPQGERPWHARGPLRLYGYGYTRAHAGCIYPFHADGCDVPDGGWLTSANNENVKISRNRVTPPAGRTSGASSRKRRGVKNQTTTPISLKWLVMEKKTPRGIGYTPSFRCHTFARLATLNFYSKQRGLPAHHPAAPDHLPGCS